ncbi:lipopolysaccharide biosynthesis protein [Streptomyces hilarionis]|uniref:lipopolysaccharide biosynthesis protein n=1 Tax=Streptomyces hilarionis TaxID=2839954 RepID=UPI00211A14A5|nr:oligosaccharide flippase family protein [Streptomyces hilarionis]MCQ9132188.1 oligosaccharide flippase family protein [Streptomyces hilarionis]
MRPRQQTGDGPADSAARPAEGEEGTDGAPVDGVEPGPAGGRPRGLSSGMGYSGLAQAAPLVANLCLTPYLIHRLGLDRFGVWSLILVFLATLTVLDGGIGASLARFHAYHGAHGDRESTGRLVTGSLAAFLVLGLIVTGLSLLLAPVVTSAVDVPGRLEGEAEQLLVLLGPLLTLALASNSAIALLQAHARFRSLAAVSVGASVAYAVSVVVLVREGGDLPMLALLTLGRYLLVTVAGLCVGAGFLRFRRPLLPPRAERRDFGAYAVRMQLSGFTVFLNGEIDALVIAAMLPVRYVGIYAAGYQAATGLRSLPLYGFPPILTRMTQVFAHGGPAATAREFHVLEARWLPAVLTYGVVTTASVGLAVQVWLGRDLALSGAVAAVLLAGYSVQVALTGIRTCFVRAIGLPGHETRYSWFSTGVNLALTVPLTLLFGVMGVVLATAVGITAGSVYFVVLCRRLAGLRDRRLPGRWWPVTLAAAVTACLGNLLVLGLGWHGVLPLALAGAPVLAVIGLAWALLLPGIGEPGAPREGVP